MVVDGSEAVEYPIDIQLACNGHTIDMQCTYNGRITDIIMDKPWTYNSGSSRLEKYLRLRFGWQHILYKVELHFGLAKYFILGKIGFRELTK